MYLMKKGNAPNQAHVGIPEGLYEEEHGRHGFSGPASHLYRRHPPTGWVRIDGPLRPRAFACAALPTPDQRSADARPVEILRSPDVRVLLSRRAETMPAAAGQPQRDGWPAHGPAPRPGPGAR